MHRFPKLKNKKIKSKHGFTLIEVLFSVVLISFLAGITIPIYQSYQVRNDLDIAGTTFAQNLRRAQMLSQAEDGDASWGLYATTGNIILFKGASFALRDNAFDEATAIPENFIISGLSEVVFSKFYGVPQMTGTTTITSNINEKKDININEKGRVQY
jgi:prepilin-type N-terminal cleavage/methylation domain-containing protein